MYFALFVVTKYLQHAAVPDMPQINYPDLPVAQRREEIMKAMRAHQVVIVVGETGSGKTTPMRLGSA